MNEVVSQLQLNFCFGSGQRELFIAGELGLQWRNKYPQLFDDCDLEIYRNQCGQGRHFFEWLAAILVFESTGYLSLVEKYWSTSHPKKLPIYKGIVSRDVFELDEEYGWPDLFCFRQDRRDWFFCEVKSGRDSLQPSQLKLFPQIHRLTGKPVRVLNLQKL